MTDELGIVSTSEHLKVESTDTWAIAAADIERRRSVNEIGKVRNLATVSRQFLVGLGLRA
jgi:hypothetical protein